MRDSLIIALAILVGAVIVAVAVQPTKPDRLTVMLEDHNRLLTAYKRSRGQ